jgi:hypothetical protein
MADAFEPRALKAPSSSLAHRPRKPSQARRACPSAGSVVRQSKRFVSALLAEVQAFRMPRRPLHCLGKLDPLGLGSSSLPM